MSWEEIAKRFKGIQEKERQIFFGDNVFGDNAREKAPGAIDVNFREIEEAPKDDPVQEQAEAKGERRKSDSQEAWELENAGDQESYTLADVREQLRKCEADLKAYREVGGMPDKVMRKQKIFVDALQLLKEKKEFDEMEETYGG